MPYNKPRSRTGTGSFFTHKMIVPGGLEGLGQKPYRVMRLADEQIYPTSRNFLGNVRHMGKYYRRRVDEQVQRVIARAVLTTTAE